MRIAAPRPFAMAVLLSVVLMLGALSAAAPASPLPRVLAFDVAQFLKADAGFSADEIRRVERGEVIAKSLGGAEDSVGIAAAALLAVPPAYFIERFRHIEQFKKSAEVQQVGRFGAPPTAGDMAGLTLPADELNAGRRCRAGSCDLKLDVPGMERMRGATDERAAMAALRAHLADYVSAYLRAGNAVLIDYRDRRQPLALKDQLSEILSSTPFLSRRWPDLHAAISGFSGTLPPGIEQFVYWSKDKFGHRPVVSLTHALIRPPRDGVAVIATKQLYSSHYTTGSLGLTILADQAVAAGPRTLVIYINRTHVDIFTGLLGAVKRPVVRSRARAGAERMLSGLRTRLEREFVGSRE